jgi:hypothetical protein
MRKAKKEEEATLAEAAVASEFKRHTERHSRPRHKSTTQEVDKKR